MSSLPARTSPTDGTARKRVAPVAGFSDQHVPSLAEQRARRRRLRAIDADLRSSARKAA